MKKILCPTDFSDTAQNAVAYAAKVALATGCELTLLNVQSIFDFALADMFRGREVRVGGVSDQLQKQALQIEKAFKIGCYAEVESGARPLSSVIAEKSESFDLIVMGTDGPDDLYQFFAGSNTYNAIVKSQIPVLMIPPGYVFSGLRRIVYAFDYLKESNLPLTRLIPIIRSLKAELTILQVLEEGNNAESKADLRELQFVITNFYGDDLNFKYESTRSDEIAQGINSFMINNAPDALALCFVHRNLIQRLFHKSVIRGITGFSTYPVIVFHQ